MTSKFIAEYSMSKDLLKDIEFIKREFGVGSVGYRAIDKLTKELQFLQNENLKMQKMLRRKELTIEQYQSRLKTHGIKLM